MKKLVLLLGIAFMANLFASNLIEVYKSKSCGCCGKWADMMKEQGFNIKEYYTEDMIKVKQNFNVALELSSCHTGFVDGYVVEGHVPADDIKRLLSERPADVIGITVPGMPLGSPGMEQGGIVEDYDVILIKKNGATEIFSSYKNGKRIK